MAMQNQDHFKEAVPVLQQAIAITRAPAILEDRQLRLAEAMRKSGDRPGALALYKKLKLSERPNIRESASYGLITLEQAETKQ
jgi:hypothetical protein